MIQPDPAIIDGLYRVGIRILTENDTRIESWELSYNGMKVLGAVIDQHGLTIDINTGPITIPPERVAESVRVIDGAIVIDYTPGTHTAVYDPTFVSEEFGNGFVDKTSAIQEVFGNPEEFIKVSTYQGLMELQEITRIMSPDFGSNVYWPPFESILVDYRSSGGNEATGFTLGSPLGWRTDLKTSPFYYANYVLLEPNEGEGRDYYTCILMETVMNVDGTKGIMKFGASGKTPDGDCINFLAGAMGLADGSLEGNYVLPGYGLNFSEWRTDSGYWDIYKDAAEYFGFLDSRGNMSPEFDQELKQWLTTGNLKKGGMLEQMINFGLAKTFVKR